MSNKDMEKKTRKQKAGHRTWAGKGGKVSGEHRGDIMSKEKRSALMSRIKGKDTGPEKAVIEELLLRRLDFETHARDLPGRPDIVFRGLRVAIYIDGDFWHGWRLPLWEHKLSPKWKEKIQGNRERDIRNHKRLRQMGWKVIRIWEHQTEQNIERCISRIVTLLEDVKDTNATLM